ncbi:VOC family protein [Kribbella deserti]|uniref:VOC family protein n=1 Tax=Kribbella deserti TaxID=1926257 RepID=A0ABV6QG26_9ACTN
MLRGFTTINYFASDVSAAVAWYSEVLGVGPYFEKSFGGQPAYVEFRIGDYQHELGILDSRYHPGGPVDPADAGKGVAMYWAVDDVEAAFQRLLDLGATEHGKPTEHGPGFVTASVVDPFGNVLGVMYNEHYLDILKSRTGE